MRAQAFLWFYFSVNVGALISQLALPRVRDLYGYRVAFLIPAGQAGGITSRYAILTDRELAGWAAPPEIVAGVLAAECREILGRQRSS